MPDCYPKEVRSKVMSRIRSKNTKPELLLRKTLWHLGYRGYRIHNQKIPGKPDIVFTKKKIAIFIDGCFWHGCPQCFVEPKSNRDYWLPKIRRTIERDKMQNVRLQSDGWNVIRIWEHDIKQNNQKMIQKIFQKFI
jgi:DNA mismatch endonuclease, patch repair protein